MEKKTVMDVVEKVISEKKQPDLLEDSYSELSNRTIAFVLANSIFEGKNAFNIVWELFSAGFMLGASAAKQYFELPESEVSL